MTDITIQDIQKQIVTLPNRPPAMLASAVAMIYEVESRQVNQAVRRNPNRFPEDFCFQATKNELDALVSQNVIPLSVFGGHLPWMFTRFGANQLSTVLKSPLAAQRSVQIMRAFSIMEEALTGDVPIVDPAMTYLPKDRYIELLEAENTLLKAPKPNRKKSVPVTNELVVKIYDLLAQGLSGRAVAEALGISSATVSFVRRLRPSIPLALLGTEGNS